MKTENVAALSYGTPGSWLLPSSMITRLSSQRIPDWVADATGQQRGSSYACLEHARLPDNPELAARLIRFAQQVLRQRIAMFGNVTAVETPQNFVRLDTNNIPWSVRTRNCLSSEQLSDDLDAMLRITFQQLLSIPSMGVRSALDFAVTLESSLIAASQSATQKDEGQSEEDLRLATIAKLRNFLSQSWANLISSQDARFKDLLLPFGKQTFAELVDTSLNSWGQSTGDLASLCHIADRIQTRVDEINSLPLEAQLTDLFFKTLVIDVNRGNAILDRLGWNGFPPATLEECGQKLGITRERIRQLENKFKKRLPAHRVFLPALSRALSLIEEKAPVYSEECSRLLRENGLTQIDFSPESIIACAEELRIPTKLEASRVKDRLLITKGGSIPFSQLVSVARRISGAMGVCNVEQIVDAICMDSPKETDRAPLTRQVEKLLSVSKELKSLGDNWYWAPNVPTKRNRLLNITNRILSAKEQVSIKKIREGVRRVYKFRNSSSNPWIHLRVPSSSVLKQFFEDHPSYSVTDEDFVTCNHHLDYKAELGELEQTLVDIFRASTTNVLDRASIRAACAKRKLNMHSVEIALTYSPIIEHLDVNIWTIRGTIVLSETLDAIRLANSLKPNSKRLQGFGWTNSGNAWIGVKIPDAIHNFVVGVPGSLQRFLRNTQFQIFTDQNNLCGTMTSSEEGVLYGFNKHLKEAGAEEGDILIFEFNLAKNAVSFKIGDVELLRDYETNQQ
jgi:hypothetical protein